MLKKLPKYPFRKQPSLTVTSMVGSGLVILMISIGSTLLVSKSREWLETRNVLGTASDRSGQKQDEAPSKVLNLASLPVQERQPKLEEIAKSDPNRLERSRARYLLASDLIDQNRGEQALRLLQDLEKDYPLLAANILLQRAQAYQSLKKNDKAQQIWQQLLQKYPDSPAAVEALYALKKSNPKSWENALTLESTTKASLGVTLPVFGTHQDKLGFLTQYANHPRTREIVRQLLAENPNQFQLLLLLAKSDRSTDANPIRARLIRDYGKQLTGKDWEAIASIYWEQREYGRAANAYSRAPYTPHNAYHLARGLQLSGNKTGAKKTYQKLISKFPDAEETGLSLRRLANLSTSTEALEYLNLAIAKFPDEAPEALLQKAKILDALNSKKSAEKARQLLLTKYTNSETAAEYRWDIAEKLANAGDLLAAREWVNAIAANNPDSSITAKAVFWSGKWAKQLGRSEDAKTAFKYVLTHQPQSYYAWRSAVLLGWDVGNFTNVRQQQPPVNLPSNRFLPPAGSESFKELYRLGQDRDALAFFQAQTSDREELSVSEQFTDGLLKLAQGKNLKGINQIWALKNLEEPEQQKEFEALRQTPEYWQALFPFPFDETIFKWSKLRDVNPFLVTALMRQESRFEPEIKSFAGATGLMQLMPGTAEWVAQQVKLKDYSLVDPDDNINMGTWYLKHTHEIYNDNSLLAVASYNAGPGNVAKWIKRYSFNDPDVFVENIPFAETKGYVESVFGNYWNYLRIYDPQVSQLLSSLTETQTN